MLMAEAAMSQRPHAIRVLFSEEVVKRCEHLPAVFVYRVHALTPFTARALHLLS